MGYIAKKSIAILLLTTILLGSAPKPVEAAIDYDPFNTIVNTITKAASVAIEFAITNFNIKENVLDGIAWALAKTAVQQATKSIVRWINSGFQGSPSFIQNPEAFFLDVADRVAGDFIYGSDLDFLCSPIQFNVRVALATKQFQDFEPICRLTDVISNVQGFYEGNFQAGGWPAWFQAVNSSTDLPAGALVAANAEMTLRIQRKTGIEEHKLDWGSGFFSWEECYEEEGTEYCETLTPGHVIAETLNFHLTTGERSLIEADEINEIISALFAQLGQQVITGMGGLFGTSRSYGGRSSYLDQLEEDSATRDETFDSTDDIIASSVSATQDYGDLQLEAIAAINNHEVFITDTYQVASSCQGIPKDLPQTFVTKRQRAEETLLTAREQEAELQDIQFRYNGTESDQELFDIVKEFQELRKEGSVRTDAQNVEEEFAVEQLLQEIQNNRIEINARVDQCFNTF